MPNMYKVVLITPDSGTHLLGEAANLQIAERLFTAALRAIYASSGAGVLLLWGGTHVIRTESFFLSLAVVSTLLGDDANVKCLCERAK